MDGEMRGTIVLLWVIDELKSVGACANVTLISALELWLNDQAVFLPAREIEVRLRRLQHP